MISVMHLPNWAPAKQAGKPWILCIAGKAAKWFSNREAAKAAAEKLADITGATLGNIEE